MKPKHTDEQELSMAKLSLMNTTMAQLVRSIIAAAFVMAGSWSEAGAADPNDKPKTSPVADNAGFEPGTIRNIRLSLSEKEFAALQPISSRGGFFGFGGPPRAPAKDPAEPPREMHRNAFGMDLPWCTGAVVVDGQTFDDIGIRYKGNGTIGDASRTIKKSIKIDLDHFGGTGRWHGRKTLNLHCGVTDPSKCREMLGYQLYRAAGVAAPRTALAEVWLDVPGKYDNQLLGVYTVVEQPDKQFLRTNFGSDKGLLMKPEGLRDFADMGNDWNRYKQQYEPKRDATDEEAARMIAFARLAGTASDEEFRREIAGFLDIEDYLRFLAVTAFVSNSDSFFGLGHNYYIYLHPETGKLHFFPWDLDRAFANFPIFGSKSQQMNFSLTHPYAGKHRLTERLLEMPGVSEQYQKLLKDLSTTVLARETLLREVGALEAAVKDLIERDAKAALARQDGVAGFGPFAMMGQPPDLRIFVEKRTKSVAAQLDGTSQGHVPTGGFGPGAFKIGDMLAGPVLEMFDADKNELLSRAEWQATPQLVFDACEKDDQGRLSETSLAAGLNSMFPKPPEGGPGGAPGGGPPGPPGAFSPGAFLAGPLVKRADADKDGNLTLAELLVVADKLFDEFDKQKTDQLDETALGLMLNSLFPPPNFGPPPRRPAELEGPERKAGEPSEDRKKE
ncbi:MAG TPA: CotH kinase family protein [Planctomycetaceae bacterium]|jgi:spore coat protein CotH